ncbi:tRNA/rRNA methyltransferase protein; TrmH family [Bartonella clarridgeiae 73]|uniref:tRNA/rRNA methyltransferase protein TrmH family n=1 Tax=Bartonella clarridgeiae (strain CCUG 45776 / CIP 104772 / 73) TaxID=696125 RepID=E6YFQ4_BARC7|nr:RNA methyltransferase [Bartonella clarridgeiae]WCR55695.1 MAG: RNA methyltransferase Atu0341 [Bartonella clarridgeiae]CBI75692.1 tRNA/rRNA methyltransferase protein; TrmH family [Bartonella clarridgeiae 73]
MYKQKTGKVKEITSLSNPIIKDLKALNKKKNRNREGIFTAEGLKLVIDALNLGWTIQTLIVSKNSLNNTIIENAAANTIANGGSVIKASQKVLESITHRDNPQKVVGIFKQQWHSIKTIIRRVDDVYIALDRVRDPGNLGTIIRTADAVGAKGIFLIGETTDPFSLETVRATMGSIFSIPLYRCNESAFLNWSTNFKGMIVGTHLKGSVDYRAIDFKNGPIILLMGNEQKGLSDVLANHCNNLARIPQCGYADSLNLAVATALMLYEIRRPYLNLEICKDKR